LNLIEKINKCILFQAAHVACEIGTGRIDTFCGIGPLTSRRSAACAYNVAKIINSLYIHTAKYYYTGAD